MGAVVAEAKHNNIEAQCAAKGMRMTEQRRVIARVLSGSSDHPDVEELHRRCAEIDARLPDGKRDTTHLGPKGRQEIGRMAAQEFVRLIPAMRDYAAEPVRP